MYLKLSIVMRNVIPLLFLKMSRNYITITKKCNSLLVIHSSKAPPGNLGLIQTGKFSVISLELWVLLF